MVDVGAAATPESVRATGVDTFSGLTDKRGGDDCRGGDAGIERPI
jgi:hypothetical protein